MKKIYMYLIGVTLVCILSATKLSAQNAVTVAGGNGQGSASSQLDQPHGIDLDGSGNLYVADYNNHRIQKWFIGENYSGGASTLVGATPIYGPGSSILPYDVCLDRSGNFYISDFISHAVRKYGAADATGTIVAGGNGSGESLNQVSTPYGIFVDAFRNVYITDYDYSRIVKWAPNATSGEVVASVPRQSTPNAPLLEPNLVDVFVDATGNIYVANVRTSTIQKFAPGNSTDFVVVAGTTNVSGAAANQLSSPRGIFVDNVGNIFVADGGNDRIQKWAPGATSGVTVAGGNGRGSAPDQLNNPVSLVVRINGEIYVSDQGNNRIQKFDQNFSLSYKYYEGSWSNLPDFNTLVPVKTGFTSNTDISVRTAGRDDNFAFVWEGYIDVILPGIYTFETVSDDGSKLYFNSFYNPAATATVNNDGLHAPTSATGSVYISHSGSYPVTITYFEKEGSESIQAYWSGPGISRQIIPQFRQTRPPAYPDDSSGNLLYRYYERGFNIMPDFSALSPTKIGLTNNFDINVHRPGVIDSFAITWQGFINIPAAGSYTFETISDDGSKLYFNNALLANNDGLHPPKSASGIINVPAAGRYPIKLEYFETYGAESLEVYWSGPGITRQKIPDLAFAPRTATSTSPGLNYKYYEGDFNELPNFNTLMPVKTGIVDNVDINQRPAGVNDHFAFMWQGYINLPTAGTYTFETVSDDGSKVYVNTDYSANGNSVVNNDGLHPGASATGQTIIDAAGKYPITITYFDKTGDETMQLYWSGPGIPRQLVPNAAFSTAGTPPPLSGLNYKYYEGDFNVLPDFTKLTPVKTGITTNIDISVRPPGVNDHFAFVWEGYIYLPAATGYEFWTLSDDGSKVFINGKQILNNDGVHAPGSNNSYIDVPAAGKYPIRVEYFEKDGGETMELYWRSLEFTTRRVSDDAFSLVGPGVTATTSNLEKTTINAISNENIVDTRMYPNPFKESFNIEFYNSSSANKVQVGIYDLKGQLIYMKDAGSVAAGNVSLMVKPDARLLPVGVYIARLQVNGLPSKIMKVLKVK